MRRSISSLDAASHTRSARRTDAANRSALDAGATSLMEPADQFYGDRNAGVKDANGVTWWIGTHIEDVAPDELERRAQKAMAERAKAAGGG